MSKVLRRFLQRQRLLRVRIITSALVGSGTPEVLGLILLKKFGKKYDLAISELSYSEDVLDLARRQTIDVFIPVLNNIMINHDLTGYPRDRVETVLQVIAFLKRTYDIPSIVLAGWWPQDWDIGQKIKEAGGNCFFSLPPETDLLVAAVQDALDGKSMWRTNV